MQSYFRYFYRKRGHIFIKLDSLRVRKMPQQTLSRGYHRNGKSHCSSHRIHKEVLDKVTSFFTTRFVIGIVIDIFLFVASIVVRRDILMLLSGILLVILIVTSIPILRICSIQNDNHALLDYEYRKRAKMNH